LVPQASRFVRRHLKYALNILEAASTFFEWGKPFAKPFFRENSSCVALFGGCDFSAAAQAHD